MSLSDAFRDRHYEAGYVYIAGSLYGRVLKIGTTWDLPRQEYRLNYNGYGSLNDWKMLYSVWLDSNAGNIEHRARGRLQRYKIMRMYRKDGRLQKGREIVQCSFSIAYEALSDLISDDAKSKAWRSDYSRFYEFG
jgi:T5orf172 domain-containing protein